MKKLASRMVVVTLSIVLVFCAVAANAEEQYQTEVSADYFRADADQDSRTIGYGVFAEMFFSPVKTAEHPYAETAFLERIGSVVVSALHEEVKAGTLKGNGLGLLAGINYARPDFPLAVKALNSTTNIDFDAPAAGKWKVKS